MKNFVRGKLQRWHGLPIFILALILFVGCRSDTSQPGVKMMDVPSRVGSGQPHLHATPDGTIWMSWLEAIDSTRTAFRFASFDGETWSQPQAVASSSDLFVNWADIPKLHPLPDGRHAASYMRSSASHHFAYDLRIAQTTDDGVWAAAVTPHGDGTATQHGFASMAPWGDGKLAAVWLDGRETKLTAGEYDESEWGDMTLRGATIEPSGTVEQETLLDGRVCDCCGTSAVRTRDGVLVAYRDRSESEIRDIKLLRFDGTKWTDPYALHDDGWSINGCPVNGPALDAVGDSVVVAWFTAPNDDPKVHIAFSSTGGRQFDTPLIVDSNRPKGRLDVALLDKSSALVSWIGVEDRRSNIRVGHISAAGGMEAEKKIAYPKSTAFTGIPQMAVTDEYVYIGWVDGGHPDSTDIQLAQVPIEEFH